MNILAIETSCDESSIAAIQAVPTDTGTDFTVFGIHTNSQIKIHKKYGGVFPAMGKREHQKNLVPLILEIYSSLPTTTPPAGLTAERPPLKERTVSEEILKNLEKILIKEPELLIHIKEHVLSLPKPDIDYICVTNGPGLEPALWVGINFAQALGYLWNIPVVPINHMEGHILSVIIPPVEKIFSISSSPLKVPALALLISGGHTELVLVNNTGDYEIIGKTRDDAVGEAFDKVARILGLPYPGGPEISRLAAYAREHKTPHRYDLPRPMLHSKDFDFSFSGIKTAVLYAVKDPADHPRITEATNLSDDQRYDIAREFENAVTEVLVKKTWDACKKLFVRSLIVGGGVAANIHIRNELEKQVRGFFQPEDIHFAPREFTGDNALMIALAGYFKIQKSPDAVYDNIRAEGNLSL